MAARQLSLVGALLIILVAIILFLVIGPLGLIVLVIAGVLLWYVFGPGRRGDAPAKTNT